MKKTTSGAQSRNIFDCFIRALLVFIFSYFVVYWFYLPSDEIETFYKSQDLSKTDESIYPPIILPVNITCHTDGKLRDLWNDPIIVFEPIHSKTMENVQ